MWFSTLLTYLKSLKISLIIIFATLNVASDALTTMCSLKTINDLQILMVDGSPKGDNSLLVHLKYNENDFPSRTFRVDLFQKNGVNSLTCVYKFTSTNKSSYETKETFTYEDLALGSYCIVVQYCPNITICDGQPCGSFLENVTGSIKTLETRVSTNNSPLIYVGLGLLSVFVACVTIGCVLYFRRKKGTIGTWPEKFPPKSSLDKELFYRKPVRVFIIYYPDSHHHIEFVNNLAEFLTSNNCEVLLDTKEKAEIAVNKISWITKLLEEDCKILMINSEKAFVAQQRWLSNQQAIANVHGTEDIFLTTMAMILHDRLKAFDYKKVYMLRPRYVRREHVMTNICPNRVYEIPADVPVLLCHLHDLNLSDIDIRKSIEEWSFISTKYDRLCDVSTKQIEEV